MLILVLKQKESACLRQRIFRRKIGRKQTRTFHTQNR